jgi:hypothetical protein
MSSRRGGILFQSSTVLNNKQDASRHDIFLSQTSTTTSSKSLRYPADFGLTA